MTLDTFEEARLCCDHLQAKDLEVRKPIHLLTSDDLGVARVVPVCQEEKEAFEVGE